MTSDSLFKQRMRVWFYLLLPDRTYLSVLSVSLSINPTKEVFFFFKLKNGKGGEIGSCYLAQVGLELMATLLNTWGYRLETDRQTKTDRQTDTRTYTHTQTRFNTTVVLK